jgi:hypothetical protein
MWPKMMTDPYTAADFEQQADVKYYTLTFMESARFQ